ncbi:MAG: hypothetical protein HC788_07245 [Sphingopyxis sp.]|nr:hypothetical protein [Sphingopyxis sp.]
MADQINGRRAVNPGNLKTGHSGKRPDFGHDFGTAVIGRRKCGHEQAGHAAALCRINGHLKLSDGLREPDMDRAAHIVHGIDTLDPLRRTMLGQ